MMLPRRVLLLASAILPLLVTSLGAQATTWSLEPELRYRSNAAPPLSEIWQIAIGPNHEVYALDGAEKTVLVFDSSGEFLRTIGRPGGGPGEFQGPTAIGWLSDTLWVAEPSHRRITLFSPSGTLHRVAPFRTADASHFNISSVLADGSLLARARTLGMTATPDTSRQVLARLSQDGTVLDTVRVLRIEHQALRVTLPVGGVFQTVQPWSSHDVVSVSRAGSRIVVIDQFDPSADAEGTFRIQAIDVAEGDTVRRGYSYGRLPLDEQAIDEWMLQEIPVDQLERFFGSAEAVRRAVREAAYRPLYLPVVRRSRRRPFDQTVRVGMDRSLWMQHDTESRSTHRWEVYDRMLDHVATVRVEPGITIHEACGPTVWGVELDEVDVPTIVRYGAVYQPDASRPWPVPATC